MFRVATFVLTLLISVLGDYNTMSEAGGSSISGVSVSCFKTLENCMEECYMSCYITDHCNDSEKEMVACAPGLRTMVILTLLFVISFCGCCCMICFCSPCCFCAVWWKKRHNRRNRALNEHSATFPSAPPLISKS